MGDKLKGERIKSFDAKDNLTENLPLNGRDRKLQPRPTRAIDTMLI
jgi:hypothetical protein